MPAAGCGRHEVIKMEKRIYKVKETLTRKFILIAPEGISDSEYEQLFDDVYRDQVVEFNADNSICDYEISEIPSVETKFLEGVEEMSDFQHILHPDIHLFLKELATDIFCECHKAAKSMDYGTYVMFSTKECGFGIKITSHADFESISISCGSPSRFIYLHRAENKRVNSFPCAEEIERRLIQVVSLKELDIADVSNPYVTDNSVHALKEEAADFILSLHSDVMGIYKGTGYGGM